MTRANLILFGLLIIHTLDHAFNQPSRELPASAGYIGVAGFILAATSTVMCLRRYPHAAAISFFAGISTALGVFAVHVAPHWSSISDPYANFDPNILSWTLMFAPLVAGVWLAMVATNQLVKRDPQTLPGQA